MKILIANDSPTAMYFIRLGWARVFKYCGHDVVMWDINNKSAFDIFDEFEPDLFIGQTYNITDAVVKCIKERPNMKVIMKGSDWGTATEKINLQKYPILTAQEEERDRIIRLFGDTGRPDYLYVHYDEHRLEETHGHWMSYGLQVRSMLNGADLFEFVKGQEKPEYKSDVSFIGGYWPYKAINLDRYILPLCSIESDFNVKIFGNQGWGVPQYCGFAPETETNHILKSATICASVHEPHSTEFGFDIVERPFKLLSNKCFVISDYVEDLAKLIPDGIVYATCPDDFMDKCKYYVKNPEKRLDIIDKGYYNVMDKHTYFHRVSHMLRELGLEEDSKQVMEKFTEFKKAAELK